MISFITTLTKMFYLETFLSSCIIYPPVFFFFFLATNTRQKLAKRIPWS